MSDSLQGQRHSVSVSGQRLDFIASGSGPPILCLHGFSTSSSSWKPIRPFLPTGYRYFFFDLPCHGTSERVLTPPPSLQGFAETLNSALQQLQLRPHAILAHSLGGLVALFMLLRSRQSVLPALNGLVLIDTPAFAQTMPKVVRFFANPVLDVLAFAFLPKRALASIGLRDVFFEPSRIPDILVHDYADALSIPDTRRCLNLLAQSLVKLSEKEYVDPAGLELPVLVIHGTRDQLVPFESGRRLHDVVRGSRFCEIEDCGHAPHEERPDETAAHVAGFMQSLEPLIRGASLEAVPRGGLSV